MKSKDVLKWSPADWKAKLQMMKPSEGGATGVLFCWASAEPILNPMFEYKLADCSFVIKPEKGTPSGVKFAESLLKKIANMGSAHTKPIERYSPVGRAIMDRIFWFKNSVSADQRDRWNDVFPNYHNATYFLIQEFLRGTSEMADEYREKGGLSRILNDRTLMVNLGKLFVADAVLGNGDRLCSVNTGNIRYSPDGKLFAIDSTTVLTRYEDVLRDASKLSWGDDWDNKPAPKTWATTIASAHHHATPAPAEAQKKIKPVQTPAFRLKYLADPDKWWTLEFRGHFELRYTQEKKDPNSQMTWPTEQEWSQAKIWFQAGVQQGLVAVDQKLSGLNWFLVKKKYQSYVGKYGGSTLNVDWTNFKIRRMYIHALRNGSSADDAIEMVQAYAERKIPAQTV